MAPVPTDVAVPPPDISESTKASTTTAILHRTPWTPPVAVSGEGVYITLRGGKVLVRPGDRLLVLKYDPVLKCIGQD